MVDAEVLNGQVEARRQQQEQEEGGDRAMDLAMLARRGSLDPEIAQALANAAAAEAAWLAEGGAPAIEKM